MFDSPDMTSGPAGLGGSKGRTIRCAIYTRKSSEEGLEQDFNSLHAQREACEAYILSQRHEGWQALPTPYDDGGFSGGSMQRPALERLLADIEAGLVDCVVVYKVDRLTRALSDFARIIERFDARRVSFVSVTQAFNTTSSMGRLTLNVLLSFAQFEREVTGERIRDKIAASKTKGLWMGGWVPIGYDAANRTLAINEGEAATVRAIFQLYLELGNVRLLQDELQRRGLVTKRYRAASGKISGGIPFSRGHLYKILTNPLYRGQIVHKGVTHRGQHPAIVDSSTFAAVQAQLKTNGHARRVGRNVRTPSLLAGLLLDEHGDRLVPVHANKEGRRYRYYASRTAGRSTGAHGAASAGSNRPPSVRLAAAEIEPLLIGELVAFLRSEIRLANWIGEGAAIEAVRALLARAATLAGALESGTPSQKRDAVLTLVRTVSVDRQALWITLTQATSLLGAPDQGKRTGPSPIEPVDASASNDDSIFYGVPLSIAADDEAALILHVPIALTRRGVETRLVLATGSSVRSPEPDRSLVKALARAHAWWGELSTGRTPSLQAIATREGVTDRYVAHLLDLAFLAPPLVEAILAGTHSPDLTTKTLTLGPDLPLLWQQQIDQLGAGPLGART